MIEIIDRFGFEGGLLVALCIAIWRLAMWLKPLGTRVLTSMADLIDSLRKSTELNSQAIHGIRQDVRAIADELRAARVTADKAIESIELGGSDSSPAR